MLLRHSLYYLIARGLPGVVNFAALAVYTRLLAADDFGRYALVLAGIGLVDVTVFQWLRLVLARQVPAHQESLETKRNVLALFLAIAAVVCGAGSLLAVIWPDPVWRALIALAVPLTVAQAWLQLDVTLASVQLAPARFGSLLGSKSVLGLLGGGCLAWAGVGAAAPLLGLLAGSVVAWLIFGWAAWRGIRPQWPGTRVLGSYAAYGLPLALTYAVGWVIASSDRLLIAWMLDETATGIYAAGYDVAQQTLGVLLIIIYTAAYPLAVRRLEQEGREAAVSQLRHNGQLLVALALAGAAGLIALAPVVVEVVVGEEFRPGAQAVLPWIAAAAAISGIKTFHLDVAFHLARRTRWLAVSSALAAVVNVVLNLWLIPRHGIVGAAWSTFAALLLAAFCSGMLGRREFPMPAALPLIGRGAGVAVLAFLGAGLVTLAGWGVLPTLVLGVLAGSVLALVGAVLLDVAGLRNSLVEWSRRPVTS